MPTEKINSLSSISKVTASAPCRARTVAVLSDYCLSVTCNDAMTGIVDMSRLIFSEKADIFSASKVAQLFDQIRVEHSTLTWPNGADFDRHGYMKKLVKNDVSL